MSVLHRAFGIEHGPMTTIHSYTNDKVSDKLGLHATPLDRAFAETLASYWERT